MLRWASPYRPLSARFEPAESASSPQPTRKQTPPSGVIAPNFLMPVTASKYRLPAKIICPAKKSLPTSAARGPIFSASAATSSIASAWASWYCAPVFQTSKAAASILFFSPCAPNAPAATANPALTAPIRITRLYRHLPTETDQEREIVATLDREYPLATLDDAMEELVVTIADLQDLTREQRYKVDTIKRETPKVGRNDPCPCGSGKKFKQCHGAA